MKKSFVIIGLAIVILVSAISGFTMRATSETVNMVESYCNVEYDGDYTKVDITNVCDEGVCFDVYHEDGAVTQVYVGYGILAVYGDS